MRRTLKPFLPLALFGLFLPFLFASCATLALPPGQGAAQKIVALIDSGGLAKDPGLATPPFLFDGEILLRQADLESLWANLSAARLRLGPATVKSIARIGEGLPPGFPSTMETRTFLARRLGPSARLVLLDTAAGPWWLLIEGHGLGASRLRGIGGPLK